MNVFYPYNILLPNKLQDFWVVHDEFEGFHQQAILNVAKFTAQDELTKAVGVIATGAANGVAAIFLYLGFSSLSNFLTGCSNCGPPAPVDVSRVNSRITNNENHLNRLSTTSILSINNLNSTTASIFGCINCSTSFSSFKTINLNVFVSTTLDRQLALLTTQ